MSKIVICGSMRLSKEMVRLEKELLNLGHIVILPRFTREYASLRSEKEMHSESARNKIEHDLIREYFEEIKNNDTIVVVNKKRKNIEGYIGGNSFLEMGFAHVLHKPIYLTDQIPQMGYTDEIIAMQPIILNGNLSLIR